MYRSPDGTFKADILIVDDTPANLHLLTRILSEAGYYVRPLLHGDAALKAVEARPPDLILLDVLMPDMDGYTVCDHLKLNPLSREIPVIFLSAQQEIENKIRAFDTGAVDYITKPFQIPEVLARIETHLKICDLQRQLREQNLTLQQEIDRRQHTQEALSQRASELATLYQASLAITSGLELSHVMQTLHEQVQRILPADVSYVALYSEETQQFNVPFYHERNDPNYPPSDLTKIPANSKPVGFAAHVIHTSQTLYVGDTSQPNSSLPARPYHLGGRMSRSYLGIPITWQNQVIGVLSIQSYEPDAYTAEHIRLAEAIAVQAAIAIQNANLYRQIQTSQMESEATNEVLKVALGELEKMANTDKLTGIYNRHKFEEIINKEISRARRYATPLSLVIFDIDLFKHINDNYGHHVGDTVLKGLARVVQENIRDTDTLARWGGEEFLVLLPSNETNQAREMAERMRKIVAESDFTPVKIVTISLGVSTFTENDTPDSLIRRADDALYQAKRGGRNKVEVSHS